MYFKVKVNNGSFDMNYVDLIRGAILSGTEGIIHVVDGTQKRNGWQEITKEVFESLRQKHEASPTPQMDAQKEALNAIMSAQMESTSMSIDANEAIMIAIANIQAQLDEMKNGGTI